MSLEFEFKNARELIDNVLELDYFDSSDGPAAIPYVWTPSTKDVNLVVVVGENAGGKSFFRRCAQSVCQHGKPKIECIPISMEARRTINYNPMLALVYGDEQYEATGINSIRTVVSGIKTCKGRDNNHAIIWDEPDIGLSEGNAASVGRAIADYAVESSSKTKAMIVITHRKALVSELARVNPHYLFLGDEKAPGSVEEWLVSPPVIRPLEEIQERSHKRFKAIQKILNSIKAEKAENAKTDKKKSDPYDY